MSERIDKLCDDLKSRLNAIDESIQRAKTNVSAIPAKGEQAIRTKLDQAKARIDSRKAQMKDTHARAKSKVEQDIADARGKVEKWKANHEADKLARYAEHAEQYAEIAILDAADAVDEAEFAALEALQARFVAEEAAASLPV